MAAKPQSKPREFARVPTLLVTNGIKIGGLVIAIHEALAQHQHAFTLAVAAFMMAGAQFSEGLMLAIIDHLFGVQGTAGEQRRNSEEG